MLTRRASARTRYARDWKRIEQYVATKSVIQVRVRVGDEARRREGAKAKTMPAGSPDDRSAAPLARAAHHTLTPGAPRGASPHRQIRSHAQKHFLKLQKNGGGEAVPPPRPKRKCAVPYPQKPATGACRRAAAPTARSDAAAALRVQCLLTRLAS